MEMSRLPKEEEIRDAARQGEDAVVALVVDLIGNWSAVLRQQQEQLQKQLEKVQAQ